MRGYYSPVPDQLGNESASGTPRSRTKEPNDPRTLVTEADLRSEKIIIRRLSKGLNCSFLAEEAGIVLGKHGAIFRVVVDPLDGSMNFAHGSLGLFGISIGVERLGKLVAGAIALPYFNEVVIATRGMGVFRASLTSSRVNSLRRVELSRPGRPAINLTSARICLARGSAPAETMTRPPLSNVLAAANEAVNYASCVVALSSLILGRIDGLMIAKQRYWDFAAGFAILVELGGVVGVWQHGWSRRLALSDLASADPQSYYDIAATADPTLFCEIESCVTDSTRHHVRKKSHDRQSSRTSR